MSSSPDPGRVRTSAHPEINREPRSESLPARVHPRGDSEAPSARLLIIDSDESSRNSLRRQLQKTGYSVELSTDRSASLEYLRSLPFDAILLDVQGAHSNDLQILEAIRSHEGLKDVPVLVMSSAADTDSIVESIQRGAEDYLPKPINPVLLDARLRAMLERKKLREAERARNLELGTLTAALQRSNEDLQRFSYAASHDLQAPVRTITTYLQLLQRRIGPRLSEDEREMIGFAQTAAKRMNTLILDLLSYSRASTTPINLQSVDCQELVASLLEDMKPTLDQASARVTCDRLPVIVTDGACLRQVLWNLINNAIKYRSHEPLTIHVGVSVEEGYWQFCVRDNGQGIPLEYAKQIFLMFKRLHGDEIPGSGIGLAICQRIIERFGGRIWVDSEPYRGSTFVFTIPFADAV